MRVSTRADPKAAFLGGAYAPRPRPARRLAGEGLVFSATNSRSVGRPEGGMPLGRFTVPRHELQRHAALGPRANLTTADFEFRHALLVASSAIRTVELLK
jgi:hypothetical protein